jgi:hypothetical protein
MATPKRNISHDEVVLPKNLVVDNTYTVKTGHGEGTLLNDPDDCGRPNGVDQKLLSYSSGKACFEVCYDTYNTRFFKTKSASAPAPNGSRRGGRRNRRSTRRNRSRKH